MRRLIAEALAIYEEDRELSRRIGEHGATLIEDGDGVLTHCNAGGLATAEYGTALAVIFTAVEQGKKIRAFADETRPLLQGARLTTWELMQRGIDVTLLCDSAAASAMSMSCFLARRRAVWRSVWPSTNSSAMGISTMHLRENSGSLNRKKNLSLDLRLILPTNTMIWILVDLAGMS